MFLLYTIDTLVENIVTAMGNIVNSDNFEMLLLFEEMQKMCSTSDRDDVESSIFHRLQSFSELYKCICVTHYNPTILCEIFLECGYKHFVDGNCP
eukprot:TRINITY_DN11726_c0_g1_i1.p2 TRINITY_DN11726_c0_g1~~TRINITY_DN11726_c0_g1_i1.p2  ORF type:complete len:95 (+),score=13.08 TRINITY_DN11726_c0_g1_i1:78-362(+)